MNIILCETQPKILKTFLAIPELLKDEEIFFWYGSEFDDLDKIKAFDELIESIISL